jgi:hypothetical protein
MLLANSLAPLVSCRAEVLTIPRRLALWEGGQRSEPDEGACLLQFPVGSVAKQAPLSSRRFKEIPNVFQFKVLRNNLQLPFYLLSNDLIL